MITVERAIGLTLIVLGLCIIFYSLYSSYAVFTGENLPPKIFSESLVSKNDNTQNEIQKIVDDQLQNLLLRDSITQMLNLVSWSAFAGILLFGGTQISSLGIRLVKK